MWSGVYHSKESFWGNVFPLEAEETRSRSVKESQGKYPYCFIEYCGYTSQKLLLKQCYTFMITYDSKNDPWLKSGTFKTFFIPCMRWTQISRVFLLGWTFRASGWAETKERCGQIAKATRDHTLIGRGSRLDMLFAVPSKGDFLKSEICFSYWCYRALVSPHSFYLYKGCAAGLSCKA